MFKSPSERCPKCGLPKGEVVEIRSLMHVTKRTTRAAPKTPRITGVERITGPKRISSGVRYMEFKSIVTLYRCKKCGHEFTKTTA